MAAALHVLPVQPLQACAPTMPGRGARPTDLEDWTTMPGPDAKLDALLDLMTAVRMDVVQIKAEMRATVEDVVTLRADIASLLARVGSLELDRARARGFLAAATLGGGGVGSLVTILARR